MRLSGGGRSGDGEQAGECLLCVGIGDDWRAMMDGIYDLRGVRLMINGRTVTTIFKIYEDMIIQGLQIHGAFRHFHVNNVGSMHNQTPREDLLLLGKIGNPRQCYRACKSIQ